MNVLMVSWRDTRNPEAGGSERYIERIATGLVDAGHHVTIFSRRFPGATRRECVDGVWFVRRGNRYTVYLWALLAVFRYPPDVVVDVQNGVPFFTRLVTRRPVVLLVHHLHRLQWCDWFGPVLGRIGWWVESRVAPMVYRHCRYITVSENTRAELAALGVTPARVDVVPNGLDPSPTTGSERSEQPLLVAVSRLVPHKRLEHAVETLARLGERWPTLRLEIVGRGPSLDSLHRLAVERGVADRLVLHGWVDEPEKHRILARSWVHLCPSIKEGWGISVSEAAAHGVPSVAYRSAGGVCESIRHGATGLLADGETESARFDDFVAKVELLLRDDGLRGRMARACREYARSFDWAHSIDAFEKIVESTTDPKLSGRVRPPRQRRPAVSSAASFGPASPPQKPLRRAPAQR
jgi:glycosyltransferase involved in cell wall biosynthesis